MLLLSRAAPSPDQSDCQRMGAQDLACAQPMHGDPVPHHVRSFCEHLANEMARLPPNVLDDFKCKIMLQLYERLADKT